MLDLNDVRWTTLKSGFGPYNPAPLVRKLLDQVALGGLSLERSLIELDNESNNQGEVGTAEYAVAPWLIELMARSKRFECKAALIFLSIEAVRPFNSPAPDFLEIHYQNALARIPEIIRQHVGEKWDDHQTRLAASMLALAGGNRFFMEGYLNISREVIESLMFSKDGRLTWLL